MGWPKKTCWFSAGITLVVLLVAVSTHRVEKPEPLAEPKGPRHMFEPPWVGESRYFMLDANDQFFIDEDMVLADLRGGDVMLQRAACEAIGSHGLKAYDEALPILVRLLQSEDRDFAMAVVPAVGSPVAASEFESIVPRLVEIYECSDSGDDRWTLAKAIAGICEKPAAATMPDALAVLTNLLDDSDGRVSSTAAERLAEFGDAAVPAIPALLRQVRVGTEWNWHLKGAAKALGKIARRPKQCVPPLLSALKQLEGSSEPWGRSEVIEAIGCFGHDAESAVPQLRAMLSDESLYLSELELLVSVLLKADPSPVESLLQAYPLMPIREGSERDSWTSPRLRVLLELRHQSGLDHNDKLQDFHGQTFLVLPVNATDEDVEWLTALKENVRRVTQERPDEELPRLTDKAMQSLAVFRSLESLTLFNGRFSDKGVAHLAKLTRLSELCLGDGWNVRLDHRLKLSEVTDAGLKPLNSLTGITELHLHLSGIDGTGLGNLDALNELRVLDLGISGVQDVGVAAIAKTHPNLASLNLNWTRVTAKSTDDILRLRNLRWLGVYKSTLNGPYPNHSEATKRIERELPNCEVMWID